VTTASPDDRLAGWGAWSRGAADGDHPWSLGARPSATPQVTGQDSIRTRLLLLAVAATVPLLVLLAVNAAQDLATARADGQKEALRVAQLQADLIDEHVGAVDNLLRTLAAQVAAEPADGAAAAALLERARAQLPPVYTGLYLAPPGGQPLDASGLMLAQAEVSAASGVVLERPVLGPDGAPAASIAAATRLDRLPRLETRDLPAGSIMMVLDQRGVVLAHSPDYDVWVGRDLSQQPFVQEALAQRQGTGELPSADGVSRLSAYMTATRVPWLVYVGLPSEIVLGSSRVALLRNLWLGIGVLGIAMVLAWIVAGRITAPVRALAADASALGAGDLSRRTRVESGDEVGVLASVFNQMAGDIERYVGDVQASHRREQAARVRAEAATNQLRHLQTVTDTALLHLGLDDLLHELLVRVREILAADTAAILLVADDGQHLVTHAVLGLGDETAAHATIPLGSGVAGRLAASAEPLVWHDLGTVEDREAGLRAHGATSLMGTPLLVDQRVVGVVHVGTIRPRSFGEDEVRLLQLAAERMALAIEHSRLYGQIAEREAQLSDLVRRLQVAQEEERRRVAYEVHDGLAQVAASAHQHLQTYADCYAPATPEARAALDRTVDLVQRTVREARRVIAGLRPTALDDFGLATAIKLEVEALRADGWQVTFEDGLGEARLPSTIETAFYRVAQEALTNVRKHAGPTRVHVALHRGGGLVRLEVRDWGRGFATPNGRRRARAGERMGLLGMRERVALLGGTWSVDSAPGRGTTVVVEVPAAAPGHPSDPSGSLGNPPAGAREAHDA
jgi:signal transduction histidine kinase/HAMP domain-containing protein